MYALNKRFRLTEYWGMTTATIGAAVGGVLLFVTGIGMWMQANNVFLAILMFIGGISALCFAYKTQKNSQLHRINSAISIGSRDMKAKTMEVYFD